MAIVTNLQPPAGATIGANTPLAFDVIDPVIEELRVLVWVMFKATGVVELVRDGENWQPLYGFSSIDPISGGRRFTVQRVGGWPSVPELRVDSCACPPDIGEYGPQTLAQTLVLGNASGGRDIILSEDDNLIPELAGNSVLGAESLPFLALHTVGQLRRGVTTETEGAETVHTVLRELAAGEVVRVSGTAIGVSASSGNVVVSKFDGTYYESAGSAALLITDVSQTDRVGLATASATLSVDSNDVRLSTVGEAAHDIAWTVSYDIARSA